MFTRHYAHWPPGVPKSLSVPRTSLYFNLEVSARRYPGKGALYYYGTTLTYAELLRSAEALAGHLQHACGVRRGDRVLLYTQNSPQFVIGYYAILRANAVVVPVNPMNRRDELAHYVADSDARVIVSTQDLYGEIEPHLGKGLAHCVLGRYSDYLREATDLDVPDFVRAPRSAAASWNDALAAGHAPAPHAAGPDDLAVLPYTSGTTGHPKGTMLTHSNLLATSTGACAWIQSSSEAVVLGVLPLFHLTGMQANMNVPIQLGGTTVLMTRWDRNVAAELIQRCRVTGVTGITTMIVDFLANPDLGKYDLSSLVRIGGGGASMPEAVAAKLQELGPNEVGEIITHGPQVFQGYWKQPKATADAFLEHDGRKFFRSGDLGYYDEEGYFFITDRLKRMINASGFKVWPAEVEAMLYAHPDVQEACVIGTRDAHRGETVKAVVVLKAASRGRVREEDVVAWAKEHMAAFKYPRVVQFVEQLPKTATGKVFWRKLQEEENKRCGTG